MSIRCLSTVTLKDSTFKSGNGTFEEPLKRMSKHDLVALPGALQSKLDSGKNNLSVEAKKWKKVSTN